MPLTDENTDRLDAAVEKALEALEDRGVLIEKFRRFRCHASEPRRRILSENTTCVHKASTSASAVR